MSRCHVAPVATWAWCAPTPRRVVAVPFVVSFGGALFAPPWHELHAWLALTSRLPSMCLVVSRNTRFEPGWTSWWHAPQSAFCGWGSGGGKPWHEVHCACEPSTVCHAGEVAVPPAPPEPSVNVAPWQYTFEHRAPFHTGDAPARPLNRTSAGSGVSMWPTEVSVVGTRWQSTHTTGLKYRLEGARWLWCAPTPRAVVAVLPSVSFGGA